LMNERAVAWRQYADDPGFPTITKRSVQPCVSVVVDRRTGAVAEGHNQLDVPEAALHPVLRARIEAYKQECQRSGVVFEWGTSYRHFSDPGTHAEVYAVNELLWRRVAQGLEVDDNVFRELRMDNQFPWYNSGAGKPAPCCANCSAILSDVPCNAGKRWGRGDDGQDLSTEE